MKFTQSFLALAATFLPLIAGAPLTDEAHLKIRSPAPENVIPNSYIVVFNKDIEDEAIESEFASVNSILSKRSSTHKGIGNKYNLADFKGYQIETDSATIGEIASSPGVAWVEKDGKVHANALTSRTNAPWGLGRISHRSAGSNTYIYDTTAGAGTTVYVVDTGIYTGHSQFGGRAVWGRNFIAGSANTDENGHGTHCAGTVGGSTYGVASRATLVAVKVLDAEGSGSNSGVIAGIQWVADNARANGIASKSVLSMSLGGSYSAALNSAVASTVNAGVTVVVAAGNDNRNAANYSPASAPSAITVGATDSRDARASFSNYGAVLDIFAPGVNILSAWIGYSSASNTISGTSMATPHVAGLAAYLIGLEGLSSPSAVASRISSLATRGVVTNPAGSINAVAYNGNGA
ncbi:Subtilisin-like protease 2 [Pseudogymnoascus australis]